jgi:hypothetical protein
MLAVLLVAGLLGACDGPRPPAAGGPPPASAATAPPPAASPAASAVLIAAGDIASCASTGDEATAQLVARALASAGMQTAIPVTVATLGDTVYERGSAEQFAACYDPVWGRFKDRTRPAAGDRDYLTPGAAAYFAYFGAAAGVIGQGYYSYELGTWHVVVLNSICWQVNGCGPGSPQAQWLAADLRAHPALCTLAYWHTPRFSSGQHANFAQAQSFWDLLYAAGAEVVLNAHDHHYERFAAQDPQGQADPKRGLREFIAGTGGRAHYRLPGAPQPNSEVRNADTYGVLKLTLRPGRYDWAFLPVAGQTFTDSGSAACHA